MNAYIYNADIYCDRCAKIIISDLEPAEDSDAYPQGPYSDGGGEADCPQHCGNCGLFLENDLTDDGEQYVREQIQRGNPMHPSPALLEWCAYYSHICDCNSLPDDGDADQCVACFYRSKVSA